MAAMTVHLDVVSAEEQIFSGRVEALPKVVPDDKNVIDEVGKNLTSIGYIYADSLDNQVKVLVTY